MKQEYFFSDAKWIGAENRTAEGFSVIRSHFNAENPEKATLNILGLGFFKCYINGQCINPDTFLPLSSDFEATCDPVNEVLSGHRVYVPQFDISRFVRSGDNVIAVHYGGGWYTHRSRVFGLPKAIFRISVEDKNGNSEYVSDENCRISDSFVDGYDFVKYETHNYSNFRDCFGVDFDDSLWRNAVVTQAPETEYCTTDCNADALIRELPVKEIGKGREGTVYDCGMPFVASSLSSIP